MGGPGPACAADVRERAQMGSELVVDDVGVEHLGHPVESFTFGNELLYRNTVRGCANLGREAGREGEHRELRALIGLERRVAGDEDGQLLRRASHHHDRAGR